MKKIIKLQKMPRALKGWCYHCDTPASNVLKILDGDGCQRYEFGLCDQHLAEFKEQVKEL